LRFDPLNQTIIERIQINGIPVALANGEDSLWVIEAAGAEHSNILRIDKDINRVVTSIPIAQGTAVSITTGQGSVWVGIAEPHAVDVAPFGGVEYFRPGGVVRIDEVTNRIIEYIETTAVVADLFMEGHILWTLELRSLYTYFDKIDLVSRIIRSIPESIETAEFIHQFAQMTMSSNWLWTIARDESSRYIFRINPIDGKVEAIIKMGENDTDTPAAITSSGNMVWVALNNGKVHKIDSSIDQIIATIETGGDQLSEIFIASGSIWVVSRSEGIVYQINPETNETVYSLSTGSKPPPTPTPTPTYTPDPSIPWSPCEDITFLTRLANGMRARVSDEPPIANRVRLEPNNESLILGYIQPGELVEIIAGPVCGNTWVWWNVLSLAQGITGWTSEGNGSEYWLIPVR
jgi:DNA-binding beta-propeller fold protein YncE